MTPVEAIYHDGVFQHIKDVKLPENQRVGLSIEPVENGDITKWLSQLTNFNVRTAFGVIKGFHRNSNQPKSRQDRSGHRLDL